jgi:hypothetical protein
MPVSVFEVIFGSIVSLLKGSFFVAIPLFFLILLGSIIRKKIEKELKWNWIFSAFFTTYFICSIGLIFVYFVPVIESLREQSLGEIPSTVAISFGTIVLAFLYNAFKVFFSALVLSLLLMPLELVGLYMHSFFLQKMKKAPRILVLALTVYAISIFSSFVILFIIPESVVGFIYLLFFGF